LWKEPEASEDSLAAQHNADTYPGMSFMLARSKIESSKLFNIIRHMPKGALLHSHLSAMVDVRWLMNMVLDEIEGIHIKAPQPLSTPEARRTSDFIFAFVKTNDSAEKDRQIWSDSYVPDTYVPLADAASSFPSGGRAAFIDFFVNRASVSLEEAVRANVGPCTIWQRFSECFKPIVSLTSYEPIFRRHLQQLFRDLMSDGVRYVDIRSTFTFEWQSEGDEYYSDKFDGYRESIRILQEEVRLFQKTEEGAGFWGARMIWTAIRSLDNKAIIESMKDCIDIKLEYPDVIAGFDFVGHEDAGRSLADLTPLLFWFRKQCATMKVNIPFFFHAGETLGSGDETDHNMFDAIALGTRRLGHAYSLYKHPLLMNMVKDKKILVECCPISNEMLRYCTSMQNHPLPALLSQGVQVALCNDDPAILGQYKLGMSHDFYQAIQALESLGMEGLGALAENSVNWAAFEDLSPKDWLDDVRGGAYSKVGRGLRAKRMREWKREWEKFCQWVCMEYGADDYGFGGEGEDAVDDEEIMAALEAVGKGGGEDE
jgi:adenosine deaminase CECR1